MTDPAPAGGPLACPAPPPAPVQPTLAPEPVPRVSSPVALLVTARDVAAMLGVSTATVWRLRSAGKLPPPLKVGGAVRWRKADIEAWVRAGCPS